MSHPAGSTEGPELSIVIPAFNEAKRLPGTLSRLREWLGGWPHRAEIIVVDDGSTDGTTAAARGASPDPGEITVLSHSPNRGKGYAVRRGMLAARGRRRLMTDADLSTPIEELPRLVEALDGGADVAIGSRAVEGARIEVHQPAYREAMGRLFNGLVQLLLLPGLQDTQCGFKLFSADAAEEAFEACRLDGFSFDVEALYVARRRGRRIVGAAGCLAQRRGDPGEPGGRRHRLRGPAADPTPRLARGLRAGGLGARGRARPGDVADLGALPQVAHPGLDPPVQLLPLEALRAVPGPPPRKRAPGAPRRSRRSRHPAAHPRRCGPGGGSGTRCT